MAHTSGGLAVPGHLCLPATRTAAGPAPGAAEAPGLKGLGMHLDAQPGPCHRALEGRTPALQGGRPKRDSNRALAFGPTEMMHSP